MINAKIEDIHKAAEQANALTFIEKNEFGLQNAILILIKLNYT